MTRTIRISVADLARIGVDQERFPWSMPQWQAGVDLSIDAESAVNGSGLMLRAPALGVHIGGEDARALLGADHPAIAESARETDLVLRARSRTARSLDRRRMIERDRGRS